MSTFNGAVIAGYLRSIFLAKQNISNALVAKGVNLGGVGFGGLANMIDFSIPVRPMPEPLPSESESESTPDPAPLPEPIGNEYRFTINGQEPDVMKGTGTFDAVNGTFTGTLVWSAANIPGSTQGCGSNASCAWSNARNWYTELGSTYHYRVSVNNLPITLE